MGFEKLLIDSGCRKIWGSGQAVTLFIFDTRLSSLMRK